jgi:hypothetical protein
LVVLLALEWGVALVLPFLHLSGLASSLIRSAVPLLLVPVVVLVLMM